MSTTSVDNIDAAAGDWFARRESGDWTPADQAHFTAWLNESPLHKVAYLRIEHAWERAQRLKALKTGSPSQVPPPGSWVLSPFFLGKKNSRPSPLGRVGEGSTTAWWGWRRPPAAWGIAAGLAAALVLTAAWLLWPQHTSYRTPVGGLESVPMADGSTVTLNTDTALNVAVTDKERRVTLERGEAFFEVAKDPKRPFVVEAGRRSVVAVGTQFSVRREGSDIQVVVTEGTVRLRAGTATNSSGTTASGVARSGEELLPAGSVAHAGEAGVLLQKETPTEAEAHLSWRQGVLIFHDATLADAVAEFNRYNLRQVVIEDPAVAALKVAGDFRATNVEAFGRLLERGYPLKVEQRDDRVVLNAR